MSVWQVGIYRQSGMKSSHQNHGVSIFNQSSLEMQNLPSGHELLVVKIDGHCDLGALSHKLSRKPSAYVSANTTPTTCQRDQSDPTHTPATNPHIKHDEHPHHRRQPRHRPLHSPPRINPTRLKHRPQLQPFPKRSNLHHRPHKQTLLRHPSPRRHHQRNRRPQNLRHLRNSLWND